VLNVVGNATRSITLCFIKKLARYIRLRIQISVKHQLYLPSLKKLSSRTEKRDATVLPNYGSECSLVSKKFLPSEIREVYIEKKSAILIGPNNLEIKTVNKSIEID
jgi:hypothetical protein